MMLELFLIGYFLVGVAITAIAAIGHKERFGYQLSWLMMIVGVPGWPLILCIGGRK